MRFRNLFAATALMIGSGGAHALDVSAEERFALIDAVTAVAAGADRHDWARVRAAFADTVELDYSSLWGGDSASMNADDLVAQWSSFLPGFDETLHLVTNHTITDYDGETATLEADFQANHRIDSATWVLTGHYDYALVKTDARWVVTSLTMTWTHESGDRGLVALAAERAKP